MLACQSLADGAGALHKSCDYTLKNFDVRALGVQHFQVFTNAGAKGKCRECTPMCIYQDALYGNIYIYIYTESPGLLDFPRIFDIV